MKTDLTQMRLRELLSYDQETGVFVWLPRVRCKWPGKVAGSISTGERAGYRVISIGTQGNYKAHRLAWLYVHGVWPSGEIDHINGERDDNRIANLRDVPTSVNQQNQRNGRSNSKTGLLGASWHSGRKRWVAQIQVNKHKTMIGEFSSAEAAHAAYIMVKRQIHEGCTI